MYNIIGTLAQLFQRHYFITNRVAYREECTEDKWVNIIMGSLNWGNIVSSRWLNGVRPPYSGPPLPQSIAGRRVGRRRRALARTTQLLQSVTGSTSTSCASLVACNKKCKSRCDRINAPWWKKSPNFENRTAFSSPYTVHLFQSTIVHPSAVEHLLSRSCYCQINPIVLIQYTPPPIYQTLCDSTL